MDKDTAVREHVLYVLGGGGAHLSFDQAVKAFPVKLRGRKVKCIPHTAWQLLEHMRIAQWDILEFSRDPRHVSPPFPHGYWPETSAPPNSAAWNTSIRKFKQDLDAMRNLLNDPSVDLYAPIPHGEGQTVLREALLIADHNAYHLGQFVLLRRLLGVWHD